jgi:hypothetical protein
LREQLECIGDLGGIPQELMDDFEPQSGRFASPSRAAEHETDEDDDDGAGPSVLPFRPKGLWCVGEPNAADVTMNVKPRLRDDGR